MIYVRTPNDAELQELKRMTRQEIGLVGQRAQMVLLSAERRRLPEPGRKHLVAPERQDRRQSPVRLAELPA